MPKDDWRTERLYLLNPDNLHGPCWRPAVDVYRDRGGWLVKFDLAGVPHADIELTVHRRFLTVAGVRRDFAVREGRQAYSMEISYSRFERTIELPADLGRPTIRSESHDGMLLVSVQPPLNEP